jgi:hypothetical protein
MDCAIDHGCDIDGEQNKAKYISALSVFGTDGAIGYITIAVDRRILDFLLMCHKVNLNL